MAEIPGPVGPSGPRGAAGIVIGILRLAIGRADGAARFAGTGRAYLVSLVPLLVLLGAGIVLRLVQGEAVPVLRDALATLIALLAPAVLSHALPFAWRREEDWLRYAVALNWCQWALLLALSVILVCLGVAVAAGLGPIAAGNAALLLLAAYALWLHWVVSRATLGMPPGRAALFVLLINCGTAALAFGPAALAAQLNPAA